VLLVDPDWVTLEALRVTLRAVAQVASCSDFQPARQILLADPPDRLFTNMRLDAYNGLHLVYLAFALKLPIRSIVYDAADDLVLAREVQAVGAFYERRTRLPDSVVSLATSILPPRDRRDPATADRRRHLRGGRRAIDQRVR
jgi:hypothetical protein